MELLSQHKFKFICGMFAVLLLLLVVEVTWGRKAIMEGFPASNNAILVTTETAKVTIPNLVVTSTGAVISQVTYQGLKANSAIQILVCAAGTGACYVTSSDSGDLYISTGATAGQYRNTRTGTGPL